jgi:hypothetical protein
VRVKLILPAMLMVMLFARAACAETWYLMAADQEAMSNPKAANMLAKGSMVGPIRFTSTAAFSSRHECESSRTKLLAQWRQHSVIARGGWGKHGMTTPNGFVQCAAQNDPRLSKMPVGGDVEAPRTMDILLPARSRRYR